MVKSSSVSDFIGSPEGFFSEKLKRDRLMRMRHVFNMLRPNWKSPRGLTVTMTVTVWEIFVLIIIMGENKVNRNKSFIYIRKHA